MAHIIALIPSFDEIFNPLDGFTILELYYGVMKIIYYTWIFKIRL